MTSASTTPPRESSPAREDPPTRESSPARGSSPAREESPARDSTSGPPVVETTTAELGAGKSLASKLPLGSSSFDLLFGYLLDFSSFSGRHIHLLRSRWRPRLLLMMPPPSKKRPALMIPPAERPPRLPPQQLTRGRATALTTRGPRERQALPRPPPLPPLPQSQAPK